MCSPNAAHSYGVNQEIELFRKMRGDDHIFYIIIDGEPHAEAKGLDPEHECFPNALLNHSLSEKTRFGVPLAADARPQGDGRQMALMKVIACILGVNLDTLVRRDLQRRQRRLWGITAAASVGMLITTGLASQAYLANQKAEEALAHAHRQQDEAESLIEYMVGSLGFDLWQRGQTDLLESMHKRLIAHYEGENSPEMGLREIARKIRGLRFLLRSKLYNGHGEPIHKSLHDLFLKAETALQSDPKNIELIDTSLSILRLLSEAKWITGDFDDVARLTEKRIQYASRLMKLNSSKPPRELSNAHMTMGLLDMHRQRPEEARKWIKKAFNDRIASSYSLDHPDTFPGIVPGAYLHLSRIEEILAPIDQSLKTKKTSIQQYRKMVDHRPNKNVYTYLYWRTHFGLAELLVSNGDGAEAVAAVEGAQKGFAELLAKEPDNMRYALMEARLGLPLGIQHGIDENWDKAADVLGKTHQKLGDTLSKSDMAMDAKAWFLRAKSLHASALIHLNKLGEAETLLSEVEEFYAASKPISLRTVFGRKMRAAFFTAKAELAAAKGNKVDEVLAYQELINTFGDNWQTCHPMVRLEVMKAFMHLGNPNEAKKIAKNLKSIGFKRQGFQNLTNALDMTLLAKS